VTTTKGTEDECAAVGSDSKCDEFNQRCASLCQRKEKPIVCNFLERGSNPQFFGSLVGCFTSGTIALHATR
jgi:hypothetical protein